jgi:hypothetical protein
MSPEEWLKQKQEKEATLSPEEWLKKKRAEEPALSPEEWLAQKKQNEQVAENLDKEAQGIQPTVDVDGVAIPVTAERTQESVNKELESRVEKAEKNPEKEPSPLQIGAGLLAEIGIAEGSKAAGTLAGAGTALALGQMGPQALLPEEIITVPIGAGIGYFLGATGGGATGSISAQKIEGRDSINWGRTAVSSLMNLIPGSKITKGPQILIKASEALAKRPIATTAAVGAIAAPTTVAAEELYETGELPSTGELAGSSVVAGLFGAGIGKTQKEMIPILRKFAGKSPNELNNLVNRGDSGAVSYVDALTQDVDPKDFLTKENLKEFIGTLGQTAKANIAPTKVVGKEAAQAMRDAANIASTGREIGGILGSRVNDAIAKSSDPAAVQQFALEYITGKAPKVPKELESLAADLSQARKYIAEYQDGLLEMHYNGQRKMPDLLAKYIEESKNEGDYLTRSYAFFGDANYSPSKQSSQELLSDLTTQPRIGIDERKFIRKTDAQGNRLEVDNPNYGSEIDLPPMGKADAERYIADLNAKKASNPDELHNWIYSQNAGILKEKKDLSPALRKYLGEYTTPGEKISETMSKLSRLVAYDKADNQISNIFRDMGVGKFAGEGLDPSWQPIKLRRGNARIGDQELYGPPELQTAINHLYANGSDDAGISFMASLSKDLYQTGVALSKAARTVFNPVSQATNYIYGPVNMAGMGMNPFKNFGKGVKFASAQYEFFAKQLSNTSLDEFKRKKELGIFPQNLHFADIQAGLKSGKIGRVVQKAVDPFGKFYSMPDLANRYIVTKNYESQLLKQFPGAAYNLVEEEAARLTNNTSQNYNFVSNGIKALSKNGIPADQFSMFMFELIRNQYNQGKLIWSMRNGSYARELSQKFGVPANQKSINAEAAKRIASLTLVYASTAATLQKGMEMAGMTREKEKAYRETVLPDYAERKPLFIKEDKKTGSVEWMNTSYLVPQQGLIGSFVAGFNNRSINDAIKFGFEGIADDILGEGNFVTNSLAQAANNYNFETGRPISESPDPSVSRVERTQFFFKNMLEPSFIDFYKKSQTRPISKTAEKLVGLRFNETNVNKGFGFRARALKENLNSARSGISSARFRLEEGRMNQQEFEEAYNQSNKSYKNNIQALNRHVANLRTIGLTDGKIAGMLTDNGFGSEITLAALDGEVIDAPKVKRDTITDLYDEIAMLPRKEREDRIRNTSKEDPELGKKLASRHKQQVIDEVRNVNDKDMVIRRLGIDDGTRARYIWKQMQKNQEPDSVLKMFIKKGIATPEVVRDIRILQKK